MEQDKAELDRTARDAGIASKRAGEFVSKCESELAQRRAAGGLRRAFLRSEEKIIADIEYGRAKQKRRAADAEAATAKANALDADYVEYQERIKELESRVAGQDRKQLRRDREEIEQQRGSAVSELQEIARKLAELEAAILRESRVIGATVAKAYLSARDLGRFDLVVIDEASMVLLPALYFVAGLSADRVIVSGDFRQLPPIVPSRQQAVHDVIGMDVFKAAKVDDQGDDPRCAMLDTQYRMADGICHLIAQDMYGGKLKTAPDRKAREGPRPPAPYDGPLTIVDTSKLWPFESLNTFGSRFNLLHALLVRNLVGHLSQHRFLDDKNALGVCTPYAAQAKLLQKLLANEVSAGTVHRYQGDEKRMMILDIPESIGASRGIGMFIQGVPPEHTGARLLNVAVSRAEEHLVILANLTWLDPRLPGTSLLRSMLHSTQKRGRVIDAGDVLALRPVEADLKQLLGINELDLDVEKFGLFHSKSFGEACLADIRRAQRSVVIFSGFITPDRVASYGDLFRAKIAEGVAVRCVTRPPRFNGSMAPELGRNALDALEAIGVSVDCRRQIHEKVVLIDNRVVWSGSLNPLSHTSRTDEFMTRVENSGYAELVAAFVSKRQGVTPAQAASSAAQAENPRCPECGSRTWYAEGRFGPYFTCEDEESCGWRESARRGARPKQAATDSEPQKEAPSCPECGGPMKLRNSRFGPFYGCATYPRCRGKSSITTKPQRGTRKRS